MMYVETVTASRVLEDLCELRCAFDDAISNLGDRSDSLTSLICECHQELVLGWV